MIGPSVYSQMMKAGCLGCDVAVLNQGTTGGKDWWWGSQITFLVVALTSTRQITQGLGISDPLEELLTQQLQRLGNRA